MRGYLLPATTGDYRFWIASDDNGELWLSTDDDPANKTRIAYVPSWTSSREWTKFSQQQSGLIHLEAGQRYYVEALQKEGGGGDNLAVAWQLDGTTFEGVPIPGSFLSPYFDVFSTLPDVPTVHVLSTGDPTPALSGTIDDPDVAITVGLDGRYYAATRDGGNTWLLPDGAVQPALASGTYEVTVCATDVAGRLSFDVSTNELFVDADPPTALVTAVSPDPRSSPVAQIEIVFSEAVSGFDPADLALTRNGGVNLLTASQTLSTSDNVTWVLDGLASVTGIAGNYSLKLTAGGSGITDALGNALAADAQDDWTTHSTVVDRHIFYDNSYWDGKVAGPNAIGGPGDNGDDGAIAAGKSALLPGGTATAANFTCYDKGINGIMVDVAGLADPAAIDTSDDTGTVGSYFSFTYGNDSQPYGADGVPGGGDDWPAAALPSSVAVRAHPTLTGVSRITLTWAPGETIPTRNWLQVTMKADATTGLAQDDVFYFGNCIGDANLDRKTLYDDIFAIYSNVDFTTTVPITDACDVNRDGKVLYDDIFACYSKIDFTGSLVLIAPPATPSAPEADAPLSGQMYWAAHLAALDEQNRRSEDSEEEDPGTAADAAFASYGDE
jgi:hypothetical protein